MARNFVFLILISCTTLVCQAAIIHPISDSHRYAALRLFTPVNGSFGRLLLKACAFEDLFKSSGELPLGILLRLEVNLKNFPTGTVPSTFAILFHIGIAAVLSLYVLFWVKLDLFTTLKALGFLGIFLMFVGHRTLSHLASASASA